MTATVTALIELATEHGWGIAFLIIGTQVVLDRLMPVEHLIARLVGSRSAQGGGAHRQVRAPRPSRASRFASSITPDRHKNFCTE